MAKHTDEITISSETLARARQNIPEAWDNIFNVYRDRVFRQIIRSGINPTDAAELTNDVFSTALIKLGTFSRTAPGQSFGKWLYRITYHSIVDFVRQRQKAPWNLGSHANALPNNPSAPDSGSEIGPSLARIALAAAIEELADTYESEGKSQAWHCFWMHSVEGIPAGEVGRQLNLTVTNVTSTSSRVRQRLAGVAKSLYREIAESDAAGQEQASSDKKL